MRRAFLTILIAGGLAALAASPASAVTLTEFSGGLGAGPVFGSITAGSDGNVWFTCEHAIGRITPAGQITEFSTGLKAGSMPVDITEGSDGNMWFTDNGTTKAIGRITPSGTIAEFTSGLNPGADPQNIVLGPDGNIWFLDPSATAAIGRVTPSGTIKEFTSGIGPVSSLNDIAAGPGGDVWFTDKGNTKAIGRVTPAGEINEFTTGLDQLNSMPSELTEGSDGNLWFNDEGSPTAIGRVTPSGAIKEFSAGLQAGAVPTSPTLGPDGNVWFADQYAGQRAIGKVTPSGTITEFTKGLSESLPVAITAGEDGNLWVDQAMPGAVARVTPSGTVTEFTAGLNPMGGADGDEIVSGPDRNLWFTDLGSPKAIGRIDLELPPATSQPGIEILPPRVGSSTVQPPGPVSTTATFGNQRITLTTPSPSLCTLRTGTLPVTLSSVAIPKSPAAKLRFAGAAFYIDRGLKQRHRLTKLVHGRKKTLTVTVYVANATLRRASATLALRLAGLGSGLHTLKVRLSYRQTILKYHRKRVVTVSKALSTQLRVC
ncbi:MAG TPA: hypothetical protein VHW67_05940 [Solirubrobacteraceae bacterium]|nr:hypothetical protein [Solirubrobacteraceae bacterium]